ncbi:MAG: DNA repair helicase XPB [Chloroflexota bacterium]
MSNPGPLIIQSDNTLMLEVEHPAYEDSRDFLAAFAELVKSPEFIHTYRVTPLSLWNAAAVGMEIDEITTGLEDRAKYAVPTTVLASIAEWHGAYGKLILERAEGQQNALTTGRLRLTVDDSVLLERIYLDKTLQRFWLERVGNALFVQAMERGNLKQALIKAGYPVKDLCGYLKGAPLEIELRDVDTDGNPFALRDYQKDATEAFYHSGRVTGGSGVIVLPCGSGKTIIGIGAMARISNQTLIVTTNNVSVHQWRDELIAKSHITAEQIGEFTGTMKTIRPITITTYQMLTHRSDKNAPMKNLEIFTEQEWGFIVYDEVHMLPAPVFRATTAIQARRRLGLTATLVREDGKEDEVFALIGPKRYDVPWKVLEERGYIAEAYCTEYRVNMPRDIEEEYAYAPKRQKFRIAAENPNKLTLVRQLIANHQDDQILVIGQYISQIETIAKRLDLPLIMGKTKQAEREKLYDAFKRGEIQTLVVSKVANFAVDLPDANVMIQVSGTYGSRQEEAQRLGRILRPKRKRSHFYTLVSQDTTEQEFGINRQLFLVEQGYKYQIHYFEQL